MRKTTQQGMSRAEHTQVIKSGISLSAELFSPVTLDSIIKIEFILRQLGEKTKLEYVIVPVGQPYGGSTRLMALPKRDVEAAHCAYKRELRGVAPEIGRAYNLDAERARLLSVKHLVNSDIYSSKFLDFLKSHSHQ